MSSRQLSGFSVMRALIKREFQEHRMLFVYLPIMLTVSNLVLIVVVMVRSYWQDTPLTDYRFMMGRGILAPLLRVANSDGEVTVFSILPDVVRSMVLRHPYASAAPVFMGFFWAVMLYYFLMTLYKQRQDRSILFWNSMPISNVQTVLSKWLAGMIGCQAVFLGCLLVLHLFLLISWWAYTSLHGVQPADYGIQFAPESASGVESWMKNIVSSEIVDSYVSLIAGSVVNLALTLPLYAWLLLVSAWSRSVPLVWAAGPMVVAMGVEMYLTKTYEIAVTLLKHAMPQLFAWLYHADFMLRLKEVLNMDLAVSVVLGLVLLYAAIRLNRSEDS